MFKMKEIAWLGGLLEGEGCFLLSSKRQPSIRLKMTDEDTVVKVADMWNTRVYHRGNAWTTDVNGACAIEWMLTLYLFLSRYRKDRVIEVIRYWKDNSSRQLIRHWERAKCHPDRPIHALGLCQSCYNRQNYEKKQRQLQRVG